MSLWDDCVKGLSWVGNAVTDVAVATGGAVVDAAVWTGGAVADAAVATGGAVVDAAVWTGGAVADAAVWTGGAVVDLACGFGKGVADFAVNAAHGLCDLLGVTPEEAVAYLKSVLKDIAITAVDAVADVIKQLIKEKIAGDHKIDYVEFESYAANW